MMCVFHPYGGVPVSYSAVRAAMGDEPYPMSLTGEDAAAVEAAVNQGIDAHLEACFIRERGDAFEWRTRTTSSGRPITRALDCLVSTESMPILLRRLFDSGDEAAESLGGAILGSLGLGVE